MLRFRFRRGRIPAVRFVRESALICSMLLVRLRAPTRRGGSFAWSNSRTSRACTSPLLSPFKTLCPSHSSPTTKNTKHRPFSSQSGLRYFWRRPRQHTQTSISQYSVPSGDLDLCSTSYPTVTSYTRAHLSPLRGSSPLPLPQHLFPVNCDDTTPSFCDEDNLSIPRSSAHKRRFCARSW